MDTEKVRFYSNFVRKILDNDEFMDEYRRFRDEDLEDDARWEREVKKHDFEW